MKLFEYEAKKILEQFGIRTPKWILARNLEEAKEAASKIGYPVVIKAQVLVGGRGKAGGIQFAKEEKELEDKFNKILNMEIKGSKVESVIISEMVNIKREMYLSLIVDRSARTSLLLASREGGIEIEEIAKADPSKILRLKIDPLLGIKEFHLRKIGDFFENDEIKSWAVKLYEIFKKYDCELVEINPLAMNNEDELTAIDAKIIIDDSALYRQKEFQARAEKEMNEFEKMAVEKGFNYVEHDGDIGIISNGAGLTMATMDMVQLYGGRPANFLDIGGGASADIVYNALLLQLKHPRTKGILINILGGITRCDEVALGIIKALKESKVSKKLSIRMMGTNEEIGREMLAKEGLRLHTDMESAAKEIVESTK